jgi:hypothetical protein
VLCYQPASMIRRATRQDGLCAESVPLPLLDSRLAATLGSQFHLWRRFRMEYGERCDRTRTSSVGQRLVQVML